MPTVIWRALSPARARSPRHRRVDGFAASHEVDVRSLDGRPVPLQVDGDYIGDVPRRASRSRRGRSAVVS